MIKKKHIITVVTALVMLLICFVVLKQFHVQDERVYRIGFIYNGDHSNAYTANFVKAQQDIEEKFGDRVEVLAKFNVADREGGVDVQRALDQLVEEKCDLIFATSYGYCTYVKACAEKHPEIQFCQATGDNANIEPYLGNYHTFMGRIYEGRYISGVVAGLKLKEMIENGEITEDEAILGYIGAFPYAEVISGYTAYYLGAASVLPGVKMKVCYSNSWSDYVVEKKYATRLIEDGCVIISQHSDTAGVASACENTDVSQHIYNISYNVSMADVAPTTYLTGCRIEWSPYMVAAVEALLNQMEIESTQEGDIHGLDSCAGFDHGWVQMLERNGLKIAPGTEEVIQEIIEKFEKKELDIFKGDYVGVDPFDSSDTIDLNQGYKENELLSAPSFHYVLKDVIEIVEY